LGPHFDLVTASPKGGETFIDPTSIELWKDDAWLMGFKDTQQKMWTETEKLDTFLGRAKEFIAIFYIGGFGRKFSIPILRSRFSPG
jgi:hypothetical protein